MGAIHTIGATPIPGALVGAHHGRDPYHWGNTDFRSKIKSDRAHGALLQMQSDWRGR